MGRKEELEVQREQIEQELKELEKASIPRMILDEERDYAKLESFLNDYMISVNQGVPTENFPYYLFEEVMRCFYGQEIRTWLKNKNASV